MSDCSRLIEHAFPLRQASIDSVHEKTVRRGHISTLHLWPARRPLAASRAALLAILLPDPGRPGERKAMCEKFGGRLVDEKDKEVRIKQVTKGGVLRCSAVETRDRKQSDARLVPPRKSREYAVGMEVVERTARRHLNRFLKMGLVWKIGSAPSTEYQVK